MDIYAYKILDKSNTSLENQYTLVEEKESSAKRNYKLKLYNNQYRQVEITSDKPFDKISDNQYISFIVKDIVTFTSKINSHEIYFYQDKEGSNKLTKYWLYHTFFPILLTFENKYYILHAGAVEIDKKPILFVADSFGGKSTLTDFFLKKGHTMISDDKVATFKKNGKIFSVPSYSYHRPYRKREDLGEFVKNFAKEIKPINAIFNLQKADKNSKININKISGIQKFKILRYSTDIDLPIHQEKRFAFLSELANNVDIYTIDIPWDLDRLEEVYQTIINFIKQKG